MNQMENLRMNKLNPLCFERVKYAIFHRPKALGTFQSTYELVKVVSESEKSPYLLCDMIPGFFSYLLENISMCVGAISCVDIEDKLHQFQSHLESLLNDYGVESVGEVSQDSIIYYHDRMISSIILQEHTDKTSMYWCIYRIITDRDIALWAITNKTKFIQTDIISSLYSIDPDLLPIHNENRFGFLRDMLSNKWSDPIIINQWHYISDKCNSILQQFDLDKPLHRSSDVTIMDIDKFTDEEPVHKISDIESVAYWEIQWWLIYAMFLSGDYELVVTTFDHLTHVNRTYADINGDSIRGINELDDMVIEKKSLIRIIIICVMLTQNTEKKENYWKNQLVIESFYEDNLIKELRSAVDSIEYPKINEKLKKIKDQTPWCPLSDEAWDKVESLLLQKSIIMYLSIIDRVRLDQLAETFRLDKKILCDHISKLVCVMDLPLFIDMETGIIEYNKKKLRGHTMRSVKKLHENIQEEILRVKAVKLNSIINSPVKEADKKLGFGDCCNND